MAAYFLVAMGVFSWLPALILNLDNSHQAISESNAGIVSWTVSHHGEEVPVPHSLLDHHDHDAEIAGTNSAATGADHYLELPSDDFIKYILKVILQYQLLTVFTGLLLFYAFIALLKILIPKRIGKFPLFDVPINNTFSVLTRTVVLRH